MGNVDAFWNAFFPSASATMLGVIAGLPIAMWVDRVARKSAERQHREETDARFRAGIGAILVAMQHNADRIGLLLESLDSNKARFDPGFDLAAWDAIRDQIIPFLSEPYLQRRIAYYFGSLESVARPSSVHLDLVSGIAALIGGREKTREQLRTYLIFRSQEMLSETRKLMDELRQLKVMTDQNTT